MSSSILLALSLLRSSSVCRSETDPLSSNPVVRPGTTAGAWPTRAFPGRLCPDEAGCPTFRGFRRVGVDVAGGYLGFAVPSTAFQWPCEVKNGAAGCVVPTPSADSGRALRKPRRVGQPRDTQVGIAALGCPSERSSAGQSLRLHSGVLADAERACFFRLFPVNRPEQLCHSEPFAAAPRRERVEESALAFRFAP